MKYKVGDKVRIKSLDWYNENKSKSHGTVACGDKYFDYDMREWCGKTMTILTAYQTCYIMQEDGAKDLWTDEMIEGLVERNGKTYPYKIGDRVILKGNNRCATITDLKYNSFGNLSYYIKIDNDRDISIDYPTDLLLPYDNKVEGLVEEPVLSAPNITEGVYIHEKDMKLKTEYILPEGYIFKDENGNVINAKKIVLEKKKKEYPKTYEECCRIMDIDTGFLLTSYDLDFWKGHLLTSLQKLLICRDAYWKIAGEEMGLGKPWEPDGNPVYAITRNDGCIVEMETGGNDEVFEFPTPKMRDAFKKNFDPDIEFCKELL